MCVYVSKRDGVKGFDFERSAADLTRGEQNLKVRCQRPFKQKYYQWSSWSASSLAQPTFQKG